jgi:hypothetical protein
MANEKDVKIDARMLAEAIRSMTPDEQKNLLMGSGLAPSTIGMTPENLQILMGTMTQVSADAQKKALMSQRRENPLYPEKSVFHPDGKFTDDGIPREPKKRFSRPTFFQGVRLGGELETEEEIELCNRFTESKYAREGAWKAEIEGQGTKQRLIITIPSLTVDERMSLPPFTMILRELLDGAAAVNTESLHKQLDSMRAELDALKARQPAGTAA